MWGGGRGGVRGHVCIFDDLSLDSLGEDCNSSYYLLSPSISLKFILFRTYRPPRFVTRSVWILAT